MNDRFMFRVWNKGNEQYLNLSKVDYLTLDTENGGLIIGFLDELMTEMTYMPEKDMVIEQCTGLKDKNGNLIYEGDLIKDRGEIKYQIMWKNARFVAVAIKEFDYMPDTLLNQKWLDTWKIEIIGNIHEQAEQKG